MPVDAYAPAFGSTLVEAFERQANSTPGATAVVAGDHSLSYGELNHRANGVAAQLRAAKSFEPRSLVPVLLAPSAWTVATFLGILKAGAAYVPLDPSLPVERLRFLLEDCEARVLLTDPDAGEKAREATGERAIEILDVRAAAAEEQNPPCTCSPYDVAYVIYTSGSTGQPKGCCVEHRNVVALLRNSQPLFGFTERDTWIVAHSFSFDFSVWETYGALLFGGKLIVPDRETVRDFDSFREQLRLHKVTVLNQTPAAFHNLIASEAAARTHDLDSHLRCVVFGGDRLDPAQLREWVSFYPLETVRLVNMFGITETTVHVTFGPVTVEDIAQGHGRSPIGRPLPGARVYVLNSAMRLQPVDVAGEMYVGGTGVSRGYLHRPELTAQRFVLDPYVPGELLYRSGDLGKILPDGRLEYLGRNDDQVQIRGYRVELREVQSALLAHPQVENAVLFARPTVDGVLELAAYFIACAALETDELTAFLRRRLPQYMVPAQLVRMPSFPLTLNGKIDLKALAASAVPQPEVLQGGPPRNRTETALLEIWKRVLDVGAVSIHDTYASLGGDSMKVIRLINAVAAEMGVRLSPRDVFGHPTLGELSEHLRELSMSGEDCRAQDEALLEAKKDAILRDPVQRAMLPEGWVDVYPASEIEAGMLFHGLRDEASGVYHDQFVYELKDASFSAQVFRKALEQVADRHSILRTSYLLAGDPVHVVHSHCTPDVQYADWSDTDVARQKIRLAELLETDRRQPFEVTRAGLWRCRVLQRSDAEYAILWSFHHAILDGWSNAALISELMETYFRLKQNPEHTSQSLRASYRDFVASQLGLEAQQDVTDFWVKELEDSEKAPLPLGRPSAVAGERRKAIFRLDKELGERLLRLARRERVSVKEVYLAAFVSWLRLVTGQGDLLFGLVGHSRPAIEDGDRMLGCFLNSVPVRFRLGESSTPRQLLGSVREKLQAVRGYDRLSTRKISQAAGKEMRPGIALFDILFNFIDFHVLQGLEQSGIGSARTLESFESTDTPLDFSVSGTFGEFAFSIYYFDGMYYRDDIERLAEYYIRTLETFALAPAQAVSNAAIIGDDETKRMLEQFNATSLSYPSCSIAERFEQQTLATPESIAISSESDQWTYRELNNRANAVAQRLITDGRIAPEEPVALLLERSAWLGAAMLGVLKAGGAYVPLDPEFPRARLELILRESGCRFLLTYGGFVGSPFEGVGVVDLSQLQDDGQANPAPRAHARSLAYIMYTSGSSGTPKGSLIEQRSILRLVCDTNYVSIGEDDRILQGGSIAFDACTFEIWGALLNGASVLIPRQGVLSDPQMFSAMLQTEAPTIMFLTTAIFNGFADFDPAMFCGLRVLMTGGERVSPAHFRAVATTCRGLDLLHVYGPTENTTFSTYYRFGGEESADVPIGAPIGNSTLYILDAHQQVLPIGVPGEICVGGDGVARGYLNDPARTASSFCETALRPQERLYRTGDQGRWRDDGNVEFIGRIDSQVKVNGFRVEPGEIEQAMRHHPLVVDAAVIARRNGAGSNELCAYFNSRSLLSKAELTAHLLQTLPKWMVPANLVQLDAFPLSRTGKVDRQALVSLEPAVEPETKGVEKASSEQEQVLVGIWRDVLNRPCVGITEDYYALGGDSIKALQISARLRVAGWRLAVRELFECPTIRELAPRLQPIGKAVAKTRGTGPVPLTPIQRWFFETHKGNHNHFNLSVSLIPQVPVDAQALEKSLAVLARRHDVFALRFDDDGQQRYVAGGEGLALERVDLRAQSKPNLAMGEHTRALQASLSLRDGLLARGALYDLPGKQELVLVTHHLIVDGVSWRVLVQGLNAAYSDALAGREQPAAQTETRFVDYAESLASKGVEGTDGADPAYWEQVLSTPSACFPLDNPDAANVYADCRSCGFTLSKDLSSEFRQGAADRSAQSVLLTALGRALRRRHGAEETLLLLEGHGRPENWGDLQVSNTVGWFTALYPFVLSVRAKSAAEQQRAVHEALRQVPAKGLGFGVARYLAPESTRSRLAAHSLPRLAFNYLGEFSPESGGGMFKLAGDVPGMIDPAMQRQTNIDVTAAILDGALHVSIVYSQQQCSQESIQRFTREFRSELETVLRSAAQPSRPAKFAGVSGEDLAAILRKVQ